MAIATRNLVHYNDAGMVLHIVCVEASHADAFIAANFTTGSHADISDAEYDTHLPLIGTEKFVGGVFVSGSGGATLEVEKARANAEIDRLAGDIRSLYITAAPGQEMTYVFKASEAEVYRSVNYPTVEAGVYKWLDLESAARGLTMRQVADDVLAQRDAWKIVGARIEAARLGGKTGVSAASDYTTLLSQKTQAVAALNALRP